jgi:hypothetical protein
MIVTVVVMIAMVFVVPMAFMHLPATLIVVVVRMAPVSSRVGRPLPNPRDPVIPATAISPVAIHPGIALSGHRRPYLIPHGWRSAKVDLNLA